MRVPATPVQEREDLVSAGTVGLIDAVDRFDPARGVPFEAFARKRVRGAIIDELRQLDGRGRLFWKRLRDGEILESSSPDALSLDRLRESGSEPAARDASDSLLERDLWSDVGDAVQALPQRERHVICRYYGASLTLRQIGYELGVSEARVCQIHGRAIAHLRRLLVTTPNRAFSAGAA